MRRARILLGVGLLLASTATFAHAVIDPIAGAFASLVAGNGGLAWFLLYGSFVFH